MTVIPTGDHQGHKDDQREVQSNKMHQFDLN